MKKNINKIIVLVGLTASLVACRDDHFNVLPNHQETPETVFTTEQGFRSVMDGAYDYMKEGFASDTGNMLVVGDALADNLIINPDGRRTNQSAYDWSFSSESGAVTSFYGEMYRAISRTNMVLDNINKLPSTAVMKNIEAEAKGLRGIAHFEIARAYSKIPTQSSDAPNTMGIAYVTTYDPAMRPSRDATVTETYNKILADLLASFNDINTTNGVGRLNKAAIAGYLSKVYLYLGDYANSITYGEQSVTLAPSVGSLANFDGIWKDSSNDGVLFTILNSNSATDNAGVGVGYNQDVSGIRSEFSVNYELHQLYSNNDVRKAAYLLTANFGSTPYNHVVKYRERAGTTVRGVVNVKLLRTADVYLTLAESHFRNGNQTRALALLNTLRAERYTGFTAGSESGTALLDAILLERRLEMAFENDRFWTLKRLGLPVDRSNFGSAVDGTGTDAPTGAVKTMPASSHRFVLPIPLSAIRVNPNIAQNPNY